MRARTVVVLVLFLVGVAAVFGVSLAVGGEATLEETWVSDTDRENRFNHHAIGVAPDGSVVAPVAAVVNTEPIGPTSCSLVRLSASDGSTRWRASVPAANCTAHAITEPAFGELDGESGLETAVVTTEHALVVNDLETGDEVWRVPLSTYGYGRPTVADVTSAPGPEAVASDIQGNVVVANRGAVEWRATVDGTVRTPPVVTDVDGDGHPEVVVGSSRELVAFERNGTVAWRMDVGVAAMATWEGDEGGPVRLVTTDQETVRVVDGTDGTVEHRWDGDTIVRVHDVADVDGDGSPEAYLGAAGGDVVALDLFAERAAWRTTVSDTDRMMPTPRVADVTGDGSLDVVAPSNDGTVAVLDPGNGNQRAAYSRDVPVWTKPSVADVDGDGAASVFVRYGDGRVVRLDASEA